MDVNQFLAELDRSVQTTLETLAGAALGMSTDEGPGIATLLTVALKKELEASEEAALWMTRESDVEVKLALARQCGDEAKHYRLIERRLGELGVASDTLKPDAGGPSPMFRYLADLGTTVERVAAGQFTREALAGMQNRLFIDYCEAHGDHTTANLYRDVIQPDEAHHHDLGRRLLVRLAVSEEDQARARAASERTLAIAGELSEILRLKKGMARPPGC